MKYLDSWASTFLRHFAREPDQERAFFVGRPQLGNPNVHVNDNSSLLETAGTSLNLF